MARGRLNKRTAQRRARAFSKRKPPRPVERRGARAPQHAADAGKRTSAPESGAAGPAKGKERQLLEVMLLDRAHWRAAARMVPND
jgi:hypothetical protein